MSNAAPALSLSSISADAISLLSQSQRLIEITTSSHLPELVVERMVGQEALNTCFEFSLTCLSTDAHMPLKQWLGSSVCVSIQLADGLKRYWQARVTNAAALGADGGVARYELGLKPWLSNLTTRRDCFIFQDKSVQEIADAIFSEYAQASISAKWRFDLTHELPKRSLCTQYGESDYEFLTRLFAEEGLSFRFEHAQSENTPGDLTLVVFDSTSAIQDCSQSLIRFHRADGPEASDSITSWNAIRSTKRNSAVVSSWDYKRLTTISSDAQAIEPNGELPELALFECAGAYRHQDAGSAARRAQVALNAAHGAIIQFYGASSVRQLAEGVRFTLAQHDSYQSGQDRFVVTTVVHEAQNNLSGGMRALSIEKGSDSASGSYRNRFITRPENAPLNPPLKPRPLAHAHSGTQIALVVGMENEPLTTERDHRVKVQFAWQRGQSPNSGGLSDSGAPSNTKDMQGNAPGGEESGTWLRVTQALSGPNWGSVFVPRIGMEVLIAFIEGDIDRPVITQALHNGESSLPFPAGVDSGANHPGTIKGWHSHNLADEGANQWLADDATSQLRTRLASTYASSSTRMGYDIAHTMKGAQRNAWRGEGFELRSDGWLQSRATKGILLSASAKQQGNSTQLDMSGALSQLKAAHDTAQRMHSAAASAGSPAAPMQLSERAQQELIKQADPKQEGKHPASVAGQSATRPDGDARQGGETVEAFARPIIASETPAQHMQTTPASSVLFAGEHIQALAQSDRLETSAHTSSVVAGESVSLFAAEGGLQAFAAAGALSVQAHTDQLEILADQALTVTSSNARIEVNSQGTLTLQAGSSAIVLDGGNININCSGAFQALGGSKVIGNMADSQPADIPGLPRGQFKPNQEPDWLDLELRGWQGEPIKNRRFTVSFADGSKRNGTLNSNGYAHLENVPKDSNSGGQHTVEYFNPPSSEDPPADTLADLEQAIKQFLNS